MLVTEEVPKKVPQTRSLSRGFALQTAKGHWFIAQSLAGFRVHPSFGGAGFVPMPGDYDGDGKTDLAVSQLSTPLVFREIHDRLWAAFSLRWGQDSSRFQAIMMAMARPTPPVYEESTGNWFINQSTVGFGAQPSFGGPDFVPVLPQLTILTAMGFILASLVLPDNFRQISFWRIDLCSSSALFCLTRSGNVC
jgi:hypothetical protein